MKKKIDWNDLGITATGLVGIAGLIYGIVQFFTWIIPVVPFVMDKF